MTLTSVPLLTTMKQEDPIGPCALGESQTLEPGPDCSGVT